MIVVWLVRFFFSSWAVNNWTAFWWAKTWKIIHDHHRHHDVFFFPLSKRWRSYLKMQKVYSVFLLKGWCFSECREEQCAWEPGGAILLAPRHWHCDTTAPCAAVGLHHIGGQSTPLGWDRYAVSFPLDWPECCHHQHKNILATCHSYCSLLSVHIWNFLIYLVFSSFLS